MRKRVAFISVHECPLASSEGKERGGINVYTFELGKALARLGWHIDAFTRIQDDRNPREVNVSERFRVIHLPCGPHTSLSKTEIFTYLPEFTDAFAPYSNMYDVVHAHYYLSGLVAQTLKTKTVLTYHTMGIMKQLVSRGETQDPPERISLERMLGQSLDHFVVSSDPGKEYLTRFYDIAKERISVIPPGVDTDLFRPANRDDAKTAIGIKPGTKSVLAVGRIDPVKGFDILLCAIKILLSRNPNLEDTLRLTIIGGDLDQNTSAWSKELKRLDTIRHALRLTTSVTFIPPQPQERLPLYYNAADVLVMPSHYESFGMVALEAVACSTPVIATDVTGISQVLKELPEGHIVSANNPLALADEIFHVLTKPHRTKHTIDLTKYTWDFAANRLTKLYEKL